MLKLAGHTHAYAKQPLEVALRELKNVGFKGVDIWATPRMGEHLMPGKANPKDVKVMLDDLGLEPVVVSGFGGDRDLIKARMELTAAIGCKLYAWIVPRKDDWPDWVEFCLNTAKSFGLEIAWENHKNTALETEQGLKDFLARFPDPDLGVFFAPTHYYTWGFDPVSGIRLCADRLKAMYLWDVKKDIAQGSKAPHHEDARAQAPGGGKLDWAAIARALDEVSFTGWCDIFWHGTDDWPIAEVNALYRQAIDFVHRAWDEAGVSR